MPVVAGLHCGVPVVHYGKFMLFGVMISSAMIWKKRAVDNSSSFPIMRLVHPWAFFFSFA